MVESVLESFEDVQTLLLSRGKMHRISNISKDLLQLLVNFHQPFKHASEEMSGAKYPTINPIALWKTTLLTHCQPSPSDIRVLEILKKLIADRIALAHHALLAVLLWPKFKQLWMFNNQEREEIYRRARDKMAKFTAAVETKTDRNRTQEGDVPAVDSNPRTDITDSGSASQLEFSLWEDVDVGEQVADEISTYLEHKAALSDDRDVILENT
ncbi:UNVERIFIED_CONTAM: hypothetical protein FKN15_072859 [Acipenser sinensis]